MCHRPDVIDSPQLSLILAPARGPTRHRPASSLPPADTRGAPWVPRHRRATFLSPPLRHPCAARLRLAPRHADRAEPRAAPPLRSSRQKKLCSAAAAISGAAKPCNSVAAGVVIVVVRAGGANRVGVTVDEQQQAVAGSAQRQRQKRQLESSANSGSRPTIAGLSISTPALNGTMAATAAYRCPSARFPLRRRRSPPAPLTPPAQFPDWNQIEVKLLLEQEGSAPHSGRRFALTHGHFELPASAPTGGAGRL